MRGTPTILLLEDDENDVYFFRRGLAACHFDGELRVVETTRKARDYFESNEKNRDRESDPLPDLIVTDLQVDRTNAMEFLDWLRQEESRKEIPVVVFAGTASPKVTASAVERGVIAFFAKSGNFTEMCECVRSILAFVPKC